MTQELLAEHEHAAGEDSEEYWKIKSSIQWFASKYANAKDIFFIGRGIDYAISLEGSLKMKEISYIHSEAYAAGELKHGTISLIEDGTLVVGVLTQQALFEKTSQQHGGGEEPRCLSDGADHSMEIMILKIRQISRSMFRRRSSILQPVWPLFRCSLWDTMSAWQRAWMWISRGTWQSRLP